eukprot:scaffold259815_cov25-Tisochrysis_lutea.AAC.1
MANALPLGLHALEPVHMGCILWCAPGTIERGPDAPVVSLQIPSRGSTPGPVQAQICTCLGGDALCPCAWPLSKSACVAIIAHGIRKICLQGHAQAMDLLPLPGALGDA